MIPIGPGVSLDQDAIVYRFVRAPGPGGQRVNKVATAVELRFDTKAARGLPEDVRERLRKLAGRRLSARGILVIEARRYRSQERNREDALARLTALLRRATEAPKTRKKTRPSRAAKERRLEAKKQRGTVKRRRRPLPGPDE